jgi:raffinose/stachyose/melibiose transport system substrate-binding protein
VLKSDQSAKQFGTGNLYAVPVGLSILGVFYNKSMVSKAPTTLPEFEAELERVKNEGKTPLSVGGLQVGGFHLWNALLNVIGSVDDYRAWVYRKPDATIETGKAKEATETFQRWVQKGYVAKSANATADPDAQANFAQGKSAFLVTGNWAAAALETQMKGNVGFFPMPNPAGGEVKVASGASVAYAISSKTKYRAVPGLRLARHDRQADTGHPGPDQRDDHDRPVPRVAAGVVDRPPCWVDAGRAGGSMSCPRCWSTSGSRSGRR